MRHHTEESTCAPHTCRNTSLQCCIPHVLQLRVHRAAVNSTSNAPSMFPVRIGGKTQKTHVHRRMNFVSQNKVNRQHHAHHNHHNYMDESLLHLCLNTSCASALLFHSSDLLRHKSPMTLHTGREFISQHQKVCQRAQDTTCCT